MVADEVKQFVANLIKGDGGTSGFAPGITEDSYDAWASDDTIAMTKFIDHYDGNPFEVPEWLHQMTNKLLLGWDNPQGKLSFSSALSNVLGSFLFSFYKNYSLSLSQSLSHKGSLLVIFI